MTQFLVLFFKDFLDRLVGMVQEPLLVGRGANRGWYGIPQEILH